MAVEVLTPALALVGAVSNGDGAQVLSGNEVTSGAHGGRKRGEEAESCQD